MINASGNSSVIKLLLMLNWWCFFIQFGIFCCQAFKRLDVWSYLFRRAYYVVMYCTILYKTTALILHKRNPHCHKRCTF